jgi:hypothetical protein
MNKGPTFLLPLLLAAAALLIQGCSTTGQTRTMNELKRLNIECRHDEALAMLDRAIENGDMPTELGAFERVVILRDAGRQADADAAFAQWQEDSGAGQGRANDVKLGIDLSFSELQQERRQKTGSPTCP